MTTLQILKEFPTLYSRNKRSLQRWTIRVARETCTQTHNTKLWIETHHGVDGGKMVLNRREVSKILRGYDSLEDQAIQTAESKWRHKKDREFYVEDKANTRPVIAPMLAKTFDEGKHLHFPLYVQPKIDGVRCLARLENGHVILRSRTNVVFTSPYLDPVRKALLGLLKNDLVLDGEIFSYDIPFEELSGLCRQKSADVRHAHHTFRITYNVFDIVDETASFVHRFDRLSSLFRKLSDVGHVLIVPTYRVDDIDTALGYHTTFTQEGYEGLILRNKDAPYQMTRTWDLQKYKTFLEEEFQIVGFKEAEGRDTETVIWECATPDGKTFWVRPRGSLEFRRHMFHQATSMIGKKLTVIFQEYTNDGVPRFPVGKAIRINT